MSSTIVNMVGLDFDSPIPLYHQLSKILEQQIVSGEYQPGQQLPTGKELAAQYRVGLQTVRAALTQLENQGLITRRAGKGTFVTEQRRPQDFLLDRSFTRQMLELGRKPSSQVLTCRVQQAGHEWSTKVGISPNDPVLVLHRLRCGDGESVALQYTLIPVADCPGIEKHDFAKESLYEVLSGCYGVQIREITHSISCALATREQASLLGVRVRTPLLVIRTRAIDSNGKLVEETLSYYRADRYEYRTVYSADDKY